MSIKEMIFPPKCICCSSLLENHRYDSPFCLGCLAKWEMAKSRCSAANFGQPLFVYDREAYAMQKGGCVLHLTYYISGQRKLVENRLILELKDRASKRVAKFAASELAAMIKRELGTVCIDGMCHNSTVVTWIPRRTSSVFVFGFDHMKRVAKELSAELDLPCKKLVARRFISSEQKNLKHSARRLNAKRSMKISCMAGSVEGKTVLLIDDVVTSASSLGAASSLLLEAGARQVISVVLSRTYSERQEILI